MRIIQYLRAMWIFARHFPLCTTECPRWTEEDGKGLHAFFQSSLGRKLKLTVRYREQAMNAGAVMRRDRHEYAAGFAAGYRSAQAELHALSVVDRPETVEQNNAELRMGGDELRDTLSP